MIQNSIINVNTSTAPAVFSTKTVTISINENNISKFFDVSGSNSNAFFYTTYDNYDAIKAEGPDDVVASLITKAKYNFSNVSFNYKYVDCGGSNSYVQFLYSDANGRTLYDSEKISPSSGKTGYYSYNNVSKKNYFCVLYKECDCSRQSSITLYNIQVQLSIFDILEISKIDADLEDALKSNTEKLNFSNLSGLRLIDCAYFGTEKDGIKEIDQILTKE